MKKPRSDSKLDTELSKDQRDALASWLVEDNLAYDLAVKRVAEEFGVDTSTGAMSGFYRRHCWKRSLQQARLLADSVADVEGTTQFEKKALLSVRQKVFEMATGGDASIGDLKTLFSILGSSAKLKIEKKNLELAERKVELLEKKAAAFDDAKGVMDSQLTEEEKGQRLRQLFGM